ncbi:MAG: 5-(carboxyamino)imidazole ribonucleotide mutase [Candidatus Ranarchaeia archaeon]
MVNKISEVENQEAIESLFKSPMGNSKIAVVLGSKSDIDKAKSGLQILIDNKIPFEIRILSAHRNPKELTEFIEQSEVKIFIAMAGLSAALPGFIASHTDKPVLGVPVESGTLGGLDSLLSIAQMPPGVPVATFGINNSKNAALFAIKILDLL